MTSSVNVYRIFIVSRPRVQKARLDESDLRDARKEVER